MSNFFGSDRVSAHDQPQNNLELMVDIETMGVNVGAPVLTIGACLFDPYANDSGEFLFRRSINLRVDVSEAVKHSTGIDGGTLAWWLSQKDEAIKALIGTDCISLKEALLKLHRFCHERGAFVDKEFFEGLSQLPKACRFWAKDPDFDMRLMDFYYEKFDLPKPWRFNLNRSVRTVQDLAWPNGSYERPDFDVPGVAHDARYDAVTQAMMVQAAMHRLGLSKDQDVELSKFE